MTGDGPAEVDEWRHEITELPPILRKPWNRRQIKANQDKDGYIEAVIPVTFGELTCRDIDAFANLAEERIVGAGPSFATWTTPR